LVLGGVCSEWHWRGLADSQWRHADENATPICDWLRGIEEIHPTPSALDRYQDQTNGPGGVFSHVAAGRLRAKTQGRPRAARTSEPVDWDVAGLAFSKLEPLPVDVGR